MQFLVDECTGPAVAAWLREQGYLVFSIFDESRGISDGDILAKACDEDWILITNDKDFGEMIFREGLKHRGVIFLRLADERSANKITVLEKLIKHHREKLCGQFVVVTESKVRFS